MTPDRGPAIGSETGKQIYKIIVENSEHLDRHKFAALVTRIKNVASNFDLSLVSENEETHRDLVNTVAHDIDRRILRFVLPNDFDSVSFEEKLGKINFLGEYRDEAEPRFDASDLERMHVEILEQYKAPLLSAVNAVRRGRQKWGSVDAIKDSHMGTGAARTDAAKVEGKARSRD